MHQSTFEALRLMVVAAFFEAIASSISQARSCTNKLYCIVVVKLQVYFYPAMYHLRLIGSNTESDNKRVENDISR